MKEFIDIPEFGSSIRERQEYFSYRNNENEEAIYDVSKKKMSELVELTGILMLEAVCILGKIQEIYESASVKYDPIRPSDEKLMNALAVIIPVTGAAGFFENICSMKYIEIEQICNADNPLDEYFELV